MQDRGSKMDTIAVANPPFSLALPLVQQSAGGAVARRLSTFGQNCQSRSRSRSVGERQWGRVRAVMAMYTRLRQIKRSKSSQRWLKLRTTVQLTGVMAAASTQKRSNSSLKREDSFIQRFSTRQLPEIQETFDADDGGSSSGGGGGGGLGDDSCKSGEEGRRRKRRPKRKRPPRSVLNPDENALFYWLAFLSLWVLYNLWTVIVRLAFPELHRNEYESFAWNVCDALGDAAYILDIVVQFRTGYLEQGIMVHDSRKLAIHYLRSRAFLLDLSSLLPIDWLLLPQHKFDPHLARWRPALRIVRVLKLYRVFAFYYVVESRTVYPNAWRVVNLVHILLLLAHWFGCFYFLLSESEGFRSDWSYPYPEGDFATLSRKYLGSLYWSTLTLTTIGDLPTPETNAERPRRPYAPTAPPLTTTTATTSSTSTSTASSQQLSRSTPISNPTAAAAAYQRLVVQHGPTWCQNTSRSEHARGFHQGFRPLPRRGLRSRLLHHSSNQGYIFTIASYLIGVFIFATIVGQVGNVITNRNASRLEFERLLDTAKLYMRHHKVPRSMQRRVQRWYDYSWSRGRIQGGGDSSSALRILPDKLKTELALHVNLATLKKVSIFQECQPEFLHDLVLKMRASIFTPGDMICRRGEVAREMFIIADGVLEVISETGKVLTTMKSGDFFGEIGILNLDGLNKRTADVRSVGYADLFSLSRDDVLNAMKDYPEAEDLLLSLGRKRLAEARKAASAHRAAMARKGLLALERQAQRNAQNTEESVSSRLTNRIRSDVNSLRNAFRKSFKDGSNSSSKRSPSPEKLEMGVYGHASRSGLRGNKLRVSPNSPSSSGGRHGLLRRMDRVPSEDVNNRRAEERAARQPLLAKRGHSQPEVIGAGLPLFERLKLLKRREEEQERLEKEQQELEQKQRQEQQEKEEQQQKQQQQQQQQNEAEPEHEVIGAGLPLFERLKLLKQREMEKREQERREQERRDELATAVSAPVTVEREERPVRHISFSETPSTPPSAKKSGRLELRRADTTGSSRWTLAALPKAFGSKLKPPLDSIQSASFNDDSTELAPETEPLRRTSRSESVGGTCRSQRELSPPPPSAMKNSRRRGSSFVRKPKLTIADYKMGSSMQMPYQRIRTTESPPMAPSSGAKKTFSSIVRLPNKQNRYSRQNTIQVVSDVETVLTDILREVIPGRTKLTPNEQPPTHPSIQPVIQPARQSVQQSASSSVPNPVTRPIIHPATHPTTHLVIHSAPHPAVHPTTHTITHTTTHTTSLTTTHIAHSPAHTAHTAKYPMPHPIMPTVESDLRSPGHVRITENPACSLHQSCDSSMVCSGVPRPQRLRLRQLKDRTSRDYRSIDDLSPEYTCLPFVKRLKILNERQKIAELQRALTVVQSTDSGDNEKEEESAQSASRPTALVVAPPAAPPSASSNAPAAPLSAASASPAADGETKKPPTPRVSSHEGNETPERVNLKKMLRSMSGMDLLPNLDQHHRMRLLRSQTVEGYALRHASFTHSSFRNKNWRQGMAQTLPSPPTDIPVYDDIRSRTTDGDYSHVTTFTTLVKSTRKAPVESTTESAADTGDESSARKKKSRACKEVIKEECISELLVAIKHVLQERLQEIQSQFQAQIAQLQTEVDQRDEEISRLRQQLDDRHPSAGDSESEPQPEEPPTRPDSPDQRGVSEDADDEDDSCYFARTFSRDSVVAKSPTSPAEERKSPSTIDELLEPDGEEHRLPEAINPEPLWQLEFGSCWERIRDSSVTSNPRDVVLDMGDEDDATGGRSSSCSTSSTRSNSLDRHTSKKRRKMFRSLSLGKARKESKDGKESKNPYIPDWEVMMLAESLEGRSQVDEPAGQRQRAPLKTSTSVEPKPRSARLTRNKSLPVSQHYVERK